MAEELGLSPQVGRARKVPSKVDTGSDTLDNSNESSSFINVGINDEPAEDDDSMPIIDSLQHFLENFEKLKEFENAQARKSGFSKHSEARDLKNYLLVQIL